MSHVLHPRPNDKGQPVMIQNPSVATPLATWEDSKALATVVPGGMMPARLNGTAFESWAPIHPREAWQALVGTPVEEPPFVPAPHKDPSAGVVIVEPDGRIWVVSPSNGFGGYTTTFPKGRLDAGISMQATALKEAWEESGLLVRITRFLVDVDRSTTRTRYYLAERRAGTPADMGWESQAVHLVPMGKLAEAVAHPNDANILAALKTDWR